MKPQRILVMGLPGAGKATFVKNLKYLTTNFDHYNAGKLRTEFSDWDFSEDGRLRQAKRMCTFCAISQKENKHAIAEFVCPRIEYRRDIIQPDILIWMNTIAESKYDDTNKMFQHLVGEDLLYPSSIFIVEDFDYGHILNYLCDVIDRKF